MTEKIVNGAYVFENHDTLRTVEHIDELLQTIKIHLTARKGSFYPNKDFGSLIRLGRLESPVDKYALAYARQTLDSFDGVYVKSVSVEENKLIFNILINNEERQVKIDYENDL